MNPHSRNWLFSGLAALTVTIAAAPAAQAVTPFVDNFTTVTDGAVSAPDAGFETGDQNPYGVAVVPKSVGKLHRNDILVSNFNNVGTLPTGNQQGTGSSIVQYSPDVQSQTTFAEINAKKLPGACPGGLGLTTALVALKSGWVIVGSLPTQNGLISTVGAGCLIVLDAKGNPVETFAGGAINGPWDLTASENGFFTTLYVTNVLNGGVAKAPADTPVNAGTVIRIELLTLPQGIIKPQILSTTVIASGFPEENDPSALIIGPTGVALGANGTLYVADTIDSRLAAIPNAATRFFSDGTGRTVAEGLPLNGPLGLATAPNGDLVAVNSLDGNIVEVTPGGEQFSATANPISPGGAGSLFGLAVAPGGTGIYFVDDSENQLNLFH
jgi:hypothetical protein